MAKATIQILAKRGNKVQDVYNVLDLPTLRSHVANGHPTDDADLLLYFFLRDALVDEAPDGTVGIHYSLVKGRKVLLPSNTKGVSACLAVIDPLLVPSSKTHKTLKRSA